MNIEKTEIWITCERPIEADGTAVRGFFGNLFRNRPEFHGHRGDALIYKHPLIQYKVFGGSAVLMGLKEGAYLLKAMPSLEHLEIYHEKYPILKQTISSDNVPFGLTGKLIRYAFATPWIGLNENNYDNYLSLKHNKTEICSLIERILTGNILSMSKSLGYVVKDKIQIKAELGETETVNIKDDVELIGFHGKFETNFMIPAFWGIGKFSSRGYGTVKRFNGGEKNGI